MFCHLIKSFLICYLMEKIVEQEESEADRR